MIRTTTVGSWPIPFGLKPRLTAYYEGSVSDEEAHDVLQAAARIAIDEQLACGLDQVMGGEVFAPDFVHHVPPRLTGLAVVPEERLLVSSSCGCGRMPHDDAIALMRNLVRAARSVGGPGAG